MSTESGEPHSAAHWTRAAIGPMGKPSLGHGVSRLGLQSLGLKACLTDLLDGQILGTLCLLSCLGRFVAELQLLAGIRVFFRERIGSRSFCRCCLVGAITGCGRRRFRLQRLAGLEDPSPSGPDGDAAPWGDHCPAFPCRTCCPPAHPGSRPSASAP